MKVLNTFPSHFALNILLITFHCIANEKQCDLLNNDWLLHCLNGHTFTYSSVNVFCQCFCILASFTSVIANIHVAKTFNFNASVLIYWWPFIWVGV